ncbi:hypothetical protein [Cryobacterium sp. Y62]|uniref:hypothetical protein n=1 Tax=Cryobacterium sp. Y62 TaxID=2048284 RepID=UPI000CE38A71|nr:hypothetical protein [Cryobacterium sp. Y62]
MSEIKSVPKKPQDHKPPKPKVEKFDWGKKVTLHGITVSVLDEALDDWELLDDLGRAEDGDAGRIPSLFRRLLGDDTQKALDHFRGETGRIRVEPVVEFIRDLFKAIDPNS